MFNTGDIPVNIASTSAYSGRIKINTLKRGDIIGGLKA